MFVGGKHSARSDPAEPRGEEANPRLPFAARLTNDPRPPVVLFYGIRRACEKYGLAGVSEESQSVRLDPNPL